MELDDALAIVEAHSNVLLRSLTADLPSASRQHLIFTAHTFIRTKRNLLNPQSTN
jgi:hypothetical protein